MHLEAGRGAGLPDKVGEVLMMVCKLERKGCSVGFLWVPAHVGIWVNEAAERAAKASLSRDRVDVQVSFERMEMENQRLTDCGKSGPMSA